MIFKKTPLITSFILATLLIVVVGLWLTKFNDSSVKVSPKRGPIVEAIFGIGTVTARKHFAFRLGVSTTVTRTFSHEGDFVQKGQALLQLEQGLVIRAPFAGTVTSFVPNEGENVFPDQVIITVEDLKDRYILATIDQQSALRVKKGMPVRFTFETIRNQNFNGEVESLYPSRGQFMVRIESSQLPESILPAMTADVSIQVSQNEKALLVPLLAVQQGKLLIERNGKKQKIDVKIGASDSEWAEVIEPDLLETDLIVLKK